MPLTVNAAASCKNIFVILNYTNTVSKDYELDILNADDSNILSVSNPTFTIPPNSGPISYPIPLSDLSISNGVVNIVLYEIVGGSTNEIEKQSVILHCDIDCCLTKLTNELIECACDCAKCSTALAKAQKVFLLIQSADYAIIQANDAPDGTMPGFLQDANDKYLKAKEICDESCGCNC